VGHVAHREDKRKAYKILVGKSDESTVDMGENGIILK